MTTRLISTLLMSALALPVVESLSFDGSFSAGAAWAQDDSDDDGGSDDRDDDDDDDDGGRSSDDDDDNDGFRSGGGSSDNSRRQRQQPVAPPPPPPPVIAPNEVVVTDLSPEALALLQGEGFSLIAEEELGSFGLRLTRLLVPPTLGLEAGRERVRALPGGEDADFNHYYRPGQASPDGAVCAHENCPALDLVAWPVERPDTCQVRLPIGMIDTGVNAGHDILTGARLEVVRLADAALDPSAAVHGTAVASLLIGAAESRVPGLVPEADVIAVDVFSKAGTDERADVASLLRGLDLLRARGVRVMNLSLAGPENGVLDVVLDALSGPEGTVIVAAAGNAGPEAPPAWPAAHPGVLAVTAVDARGRVYRGAQRGDHIDLAAPGVGLLAATSIRGARGKTGTSYAVPFVTAAVALMLSQNPALTPAEVAEALKARARDLGAEGPDDVFGAGLLEASTLCDPVGLAVD